MLQLRGNSFPFVSFQHGRSILCIIMLSAFLPVLENLLRDGVHRRGDTRKRPAPRGERAELLLHYFLSCCYSASPPLRPTFFSFALTAADSILTATTTTASRAGEAAYLSIQFNSIDRFSFRGVWRRARRSMLHGRTPRFSASIPFPRSLLGSDNRSRRAVMHAMRNHHFHKLHATPRRRVSLPLI